METKTEQRAIGWGWLWLGLYLFLMVVVVWSLFAARRWAFSELATQQSVGDWQAWREDVRKNNESSPVRRRVPASAEPPALVLLRDYFAVLAAGAALFSSVLYWIMVWFIQGATQSSHRSAKPG